MSQRPVLAAIFCAGLQFILTVAILKLGALYAPPAAFGKVKLVAFASTIILPLVLVQVFGLWSRLGLGVAQLKPTGFFAASLLTAALFLPWGYHAPDSVAGTLTIQFFNAIGEELLFRGVIFALLLPLPMGRAIVLNGVLFGAMHLIHGFMGAPWDVALGKALVTAVCGMMFTAVRYQTGSLVLVIILHMVLNLCMIFSNIEASAGPAVTFGVERVANVIELALVAWLLLAGRRSAAALRELRA
ncbi:CPBP family intramembrane glutamic endopeptidase [Zemynaea arenosa]|nr:CPBP family intramembrane glutamic endopeptidase [Massilia arenosa]